MDNNREHYSSSALIILQDCGVSVLASLLSILLVRWMSDPISGFSLLVGKWLLYALAASFIGFFVTRSYKAVRRYTMRPDEILSCCERAWDAGLRTFVLQGGENPAAAEGLAPVVAGIRAAWPDAAITLSLGELPPETYALLRRNGADRFLLRHETADPAHYARLHPAGMTLEGRLACLRALRSLGYQVGMGMMVGSPFQTEDALLADLRLLASFRPEMVGIGPFIPHHDTPFRDEPAGTLELTLYLLSMIRLIYPNVLLPATTALGTIDPRGREKGMLAGANVVMPNLSPVAVRKQYELYDNKICTGDESAQCRSCLGLRMNLIGYELAVDRGDIRK